MVFVYILRCNDNTYYTGITQNYEVRLKQHYGGRCRYTRSRLPLELACKFEVVDRKSAAKIERLIKDKGAMNWMLANLQLIVFHSTGGKGWIGGVL